MPTLLVRELPEDVYRRLKRLAESENRSLGQETVVLLRKAPAIDMSHRQRRETLLETLRDIEPVDTRGLPSPEEIIREDRDRRLRCSTQAP